ncbi:hypothetical protein EUGRSUZ_G01525 [Eucalyptus grandis]|uniref:Uncharacterized protein n=2 Tax=Eucalyptus grandis TaxID=71139 RepID=A0ACC3K2X8_EUCGR|nr:hypothetical protein EUGRSUZ_G01525 [Eucalyptus grandis]
MATIYKLSGVGDRRRERRGRGRRQRRRKVYAGGDMRGCLSDRALGFMGEFGRLEIYKVGQFGLSRV